MQPKERLNKKRKMEKNNDSKHTLFGRISVRFVGFVVLATLLTGGIISFVGITISKNTIRQEILNNSHRKGLDKEEAINEMKRCSGTQFDPEIVDVFVNQVLPYNYDFVGGYPILSLLMHAQGS